MIYFQKSDVVMCDVIGQNALCLGTFYNLTNIRVVCKVNFDWYSSGFQIGFFVKKKEIMKKRKKNSFDCYMFTCYVWTKIIYEHKSK